MTSTNPKIVAAIVLGSSKITGLVGTKDIDGTIRIKANIAQPSADFIGKGRVLNVEKMTACLQGIRSRLEEKASCRIKCFYVAIDCLGLRSVTNEVSIQLPNMELVTEELLSSINVRNREGKPAGREILEAIPLKYVLGTQTTHEPRGMETNNLQAKYLNIICNTNTISTIANCFRRANIEIAESRLHIGAMHLASAITTEQERAAGCAIVDMGSETTTVAVYKGKFLRHLVVIPLGSNSITRDIENVFFVERDEAEHLKVNYGYPEADHINDKEEFNLRDGGRKKKYSELANIIDARVEEIVQNVKHQIELSGYNFESLVNGLILCGGGSQMKNIAEAYKHHFKEWNVRVVKNASRFTIVPKNFNDNGAYNAALGIVDNATVNCFGGEYGGLFGGDEILTPEELAAKEAKEAEEKRLAEEKRKAEEKRIADEQARIANAQKTPEELSRDSARQALAQAAANNIPNIADIEDDEDDDDEEEEKPVRKKSKKVKKPSGISSFFGKIGKALQDLVSEPVE